MKCQFFPFFGVLFALAFAPGLTSVDAAGETAMDTATIEAITGLKGVSNQAEGTFKVSKPGMMLRSSSIRSAWLHFLKTLRGADINIVAIHQHMTGENPRMIFLHYYGRGKALTLAEGVKAAIDTQPLAANQ